MVHRSDPGDLFLRWLAVVYLPLGVLGLMLVLLPLGLLPRWTRWLVVPLGVYAFPAVRLLLERKRSGLGLHLPRKIMVFVGVVAALGAIGALFFVFGMETLNTSRGLTLVFTGGCLMILSVTLPTFRLIDIVLRKIGRLVKRLRGGSPVQRSRPPGASPSAAPRRPAGSPARSRPSSPRPARPGPAKRVPAGGRVSPLQRVVRSVARSSIITVRRAGATVSAALANASNNRHSPARVRPPGTERPRNAR